MDVGADSGADENVRSPYDRSYVRSSLHRIVKASWKAVTYGQEWPRCLTPLNVDDLFATS